MKDLDYVYDKFENLILFLEAEVNGAYECDEVAEAKEALDALYQIIESCENEVVNGKLYRVIDNTDMEYYNVKVGDICTLIDTCDEHGAWFHNDRWRHDGDWCLSWSMVEEVK